MKIMKPITILTYLLIMILMIYINTNKNIVFCGQTPILSKELVQVTNFNLLTKCNIIIKGLTGATYSLESSLYIVDKEFVNNLVVKHVTGAELNISDIANAYKHMFLSFRLNEFETYLTKELKVEYNKNLQKYYDNFIISMFLTKESLSYLVKNGGTIEKIFNYQLRDSLLSGTKSKQFLGAIAQVYQSNDFNIIIKSFNDFEKLSKITNNEGLNTLIKEFTTTSEQNYLIYNTIGDLYSIVEKKGLENLKTYFSLNNFEFAEKNKILLEKDIIGKSTDIYDVNQKIKKYFDILYEIEQKK